MTDDKNIRKMADDLADACIDFFLDNLEAEIKKSSDMIKANNPISVIDVLQGAVDKYHLTSLEESDDLKKIVEKTISKPLSDLQKKAFMTHVYNGAFKIAQAIIEQVESRVSKIMSRAFKDGQKMYTPVFLCDAIKDVVGDLKINSLSVNEEEGASVICIGIDLAERIFPVIVVVSAAPEKDALENGLLKEVS